MKKIGILGGTFDPIHNGHLMMAEAACEEAALDELWFMPTGTPAYKKEIQRVTDGEHRARMTELAVAGHPGWSCSRIELERTGNTYTADTLKQLAAQRPDDWFYYIVGADSLDYMDHWYHPEEIFSRAVILAVMRKTQSRQEVEQKIRALKSSFHAQIRLLSHAQLDVSSTMLRAMTAAGESIAAFVPAAVAEYIKSESLYLSPSAH